MNSADSPRVARGFVLGAVAAALLFVALAAIVSTSVGRQERRVFEAIVTRTVADAAEVLDEVILDVDHDGGHLLEHGTAPDSPYISSLVGWRNGPDAEPIAAPSGTRLDPLPGTLDETSSAVALVDGQLRVDVRVPAGLVAATIDLEAVRAEIERRSAGMAGVGFAVDYDGPLGEPELGAAGFAMVETVDIGGTELPLMVGSGPNVAQSGRIPVVLTFAVVAVIVVGLVLVIGRVTAQRVAESERRAALSEEIVAGKDRFIASVSHELRTPLSAIQGFSMELRDNVFDPPELFEIAHIIAQQSSEMSLLIEDLLVAGRMEAGTLVVSPEPMNVVEAISECLAVLTIPEDSTITLDLRPLWVHGDALRVRQIIRNLVTNAVRYGGDSIHVRIGSLGALGYVEVEDDGSGIASEDPSVIFLPYSRLAESTTMPAAVGLGLTVAKELAEAMGGTLVYERREERTVFRLSLPLVAEPGSSLQTDVESAG